MHPDIYALLVHLKKMLDDRCWIYMTTNGQLLHKHIDLIKLDYIKSISISLNAATEQTHELMMGVGKDAFSRIVKNIKMLVDLRDNQINDLNICLKSVVSKINVHEIGQFVDLGNELNVNELRITPLVPFPLNDEDLLMNMDYYKLSPLFSSNYDVHIQHAVDAISKSRMRINTDPSAWIKRIFPSPELIGKFRSDLDAGFDINESNHNIMNRTAPLKCNRVYRALYMDRGFFELWPCCMIDTIDGFEKVRFSGDGDFFSSWNAPLLVEIRRSLIEGPLKDICKRCTIRFE